jgi:hypothetical protein
MDDMITFEVTISFNNKAVHSAQFLAEDWADAFPQAAEIVEAVGNGDHIVDVKIDRIPAG